LGGDLADIIIQQSAPPAKDTCFGPSAPRGPVLWSIDAAGGERLMNHTVAFKQHAPDDASPPTHRSRHQGWFDGPIPQR
jgi:hypothetical protein